MSELYTSVHAALARGAKTTEEIVAECRRPGLNCRPETIVLFLELSKEIEQRDGKWLLKSKSRSTEIEESIERAFASGKTYIPIDQLGQYLNEDQNVSKDDIDRTCEETGKYQIHGKFIVRRAN
jgi:hypothetical protein